MLAYEALAAISIQHLKRMLYRRFVDASRRRGPNPERWPAQAVIKSGHE